ncbi:RING-6 [Arthroderma uncinatum]|uniref:RING-6 n=1 Tax=Arthroderma uncinatum TaxID=74035 RepID=UPI00144ABDB2|nr:RING-6 [Arthroderma uncinatum]KAF3484025.1 RING-6 [Arthroderma uncinatum]
MSQVHKESLSQVDNALPNRSSLEIEIFGMEGVPDDVLQTHNQRVLQQYQQAEAERRAATGNPAPGASGGSGQSKKPKFESPSELKKRLAEHKARLAEQAAGGSSGDATPVGAGQAQSTPSGTQYPPTAPQYPAAQQPTNGSNQEYHYSAPYGQPPNAFPPQQPGSGAYVPPTGPQGYPLPQFSPQNMSPSAYPQATLPSNVSPVGASPTLPYHHQQQALRTHTPPQTMPPSYPARTPSLPPAPGLPQRPSFGAPQVNAFQMQQLHHGQVSAPPSTVAIPTEAQSNRAYPSTDAHAESVSASADRLISEAAKQARELPAKPSPAPGTPEEGAAGKSTKKEKAKSTRLVYSDNEISPEEKLSRLPRYAFVRERKDEAVLEETVSVPVASS